MEPLALTLLLIADLPPLSDLDRFPPPEVVAAMESWGQEYRAARERQRPWGSLGGGYGTPAYAHWAAWSSLKMAQSKYLIDEVRRQQLARLRWWLGRDDYAAGLMPTAVPWRDFVKVD